MGRRCRDWKSADRNLYGDGSAPADLARIQGDRPMKCTQPMLRLATALLLACRLQAAGLPEAIQKLIDSSPAARTAFWGIRIVDLATGKNLYELNPDRFFVPASNTKLFSTSLALTRLGPDYTFTTRVWAASPPDDQGRIRGSIRL